MVVRNDEGGWKWVVIILFVVSAVIVVVYFNHDHEQNSQLEEVGIRGSDNARRLSGQEKFESAIAENSPGVASDPVVSPKILRVKDRLTGRFFSRVMLMFRSNDGELIKTIDGLDGGTDVFPIPEGWGKGGTMSIRLNPAFGGDLKFSIDYRNLSDGEIRLEHGEALVESFAEIDVFARHHLTIQAGHREVESASLRLYPFPENIDQPDLHPDLAELNRFTPRSYLGAYLNSVSEESEKVYLKQFPIVSNFNRDGQNYVDVAYSGQMAIVVDADGFDSSVSLISVERGQPSSSLIELERPAVLSGRVVDGDGKGIQGARVRVLCVRSLEKGDVVSAEDQLAQELRSNSVTGLTTLTTHRSVTSGEDGSFRMRIPRKTWVKVWVWRPGHARYSVEVEAGDIGKEEVRLVLEPMDRPPRMDVFIKGEPAASGRIVVSQVKPYSGVQINWPRFEIEGGSVDVSCLQPGATYAGFLVDDDGRTVVGLGGRFTCVPGGRIDIQQVEVETADD